jgi:hypothetical protein
MMVRLLRRTLPVLLVATLAAIGYDAWFFYSRWRDRRDAERMRQAAESERARETLEMLGGGQLKILSFYASPAAIRRGEHADLCYGVNGAKSVRLDPAGEALHPSLSRCIQVAPVKTTNYRLVAVDASGRTASQSFTLTVKP